MFLKLTKDQQEAVRNAVVRALGHDYMSQMNYMALAMLPNSGKPTFVPIKERTPITKVAVYFDHVTDIEREKENDSGETTFRD